MSTPTKQTNPLRMIATSYTKKLTSLGTSQAVCASTPNEELRMNTAEAG
jgi:hypothetical protein